MGLDLSISREYFFLSLFVCWLSRSLSPPYDSHRTNFSIICASTNAFTEIADQSAGRVDITWQFVNCKDPSVALETLPVSFAWKTGSSRYWVGFCPFYRTTSISPRLIFQSPLLDARLPFKLDTLLDLSSLSQFSREDRMSILLGKTTTTSWHPAVSVLVHSR